MALTETQLRRNKVAILTRHHPDSTQLANARRSLTESKLEDQIKRAVDAWPPLTPEQRERLASLLRPSGVGHV